MRRSSRALFCRSNFSAPASCAVRKIFSRREHAAAEKFLAPPLADLLRPVHPAGVAQTQKKPRLFILREPPAVEAGQQQSPSPIRATPRGPAPPGQNQP